MSVFLYCYNLEYSCILFFVPCFSDDFTSMIFNVHLTLKIMTAKAKKKLLLADFDKKHQLQCCDTYFIIISLCAISLSMLHVHISYFIIYDWMRSYSTSCVLLKVIQYHIYFVHHFLYFCKMKSQAIWQQCTGNGRKLSYEWKPRQSLGRHVIQKFVTFALKRIYWNKMLQRIFSLSFFKQLVSHCIKKIVHY